MVNPIINTSMRENYDTFGVAEYYKNHVQESCKFYPVLLLTVLTDCESSQNLDRNPHYLALKKCLSQFMDTYSEKEKPTSIKVLDLAAGSGEATEVRPRFRSERCFQRLF